MGQTLSHPSPSTLHRQQEWAWRDGQKFWPFMEDVKSVWNSKQEIFQILQPFWTSSHRRSNCIIQRKGHFLTIYTQETQTFGIKIYKLCDETGYTRIWKFIWTETDSKMCNVWLQHMQQYQNWQRKYKDMATNCICTIISPPQNYSKTWPWSKFTVVVLSDPTGTACHRT